jgi:hypothetical protein
MKRSACLSALLAAVMLGSAARAEDALPEPAPPATGTGELATGGALTVIGALSFASAPLCETRIVNAPQQGSCFAVSFVAGTPFIVIGIPFIVYGAIQHAKYKDWARRHPTLSAFSVTPTSRGGAIGWVASF